jgi:pyridoxine 5-phosphate synthase
MENSKRDNHMTLRLGVNIDHVATIRNARGGVHPSPLQAALSAIEAGADGITIHLREDRRHIRDGDAKEIRAQISKPLNFEMAATPFMLDFALALKPHAVCLVPEKREERTTEGGLDVVTHFQTLKPLIKELKAAKIRVSLFIGPDPLAVNAALDLGAPVIELHTGAWCEGDAKEWSRLKAATKLAASLGLEVHAGHGLNYETAQQISSLKEIAELNIGHFLVGEALLEGLPNVIGKMKQAMKKGRETTPSL